MLPILFSSGYIFRHLRSLHWQIFIVVYLKVASKTYLKGVATSQPRVCNATSGLLSFLFRQAWKILNLCHFHSRQTCLEFYRSTEDRALTTWKRGSRTHFPLDTGGHSYMTPLTRVACNKSQMEAMAIVDRTRHLSTGSCANGHSCQTGSVL